MFGCEAFCCGAFLYATVEFLLHRTSISNRPRLISVHCRSQRLGSLGGFLFSSCRVLPLKFSNGLLSRHLASLDFLEIGLRVREKPERIARCRVRRSPFGSGARLAGGLELPHV